MGLATPLGMACCTGLGLRWIGGRLGLASMGGAALLAVALAHAEERREEAPALVAVRRIEPRSYDVTLPAKLGLLEAGEHRSLAFETAGRLERIAAEGSRVAGDEELAGLASTLEDAQLRQARLRVSQAESEYERVRNLHGSGAASDKTLEHAETEVALLRAASDAASEQLARRSLRAPFAGIVTETFFEPGEVVQPGAPAAILMSLDALRLHVGVPGYQVSAVHPDARVLVAVPTHGDGEVEGRVARVAAAAPEGRHLFEVEIRVPNEAGRFRPGMSARARIVTRSLDHALIVPLEHMVERAGRRLVFFVEAGTARAVDVGDAIFHGDVVVLDGALPYRDLVVRGERDLADGRPVLVDDSVLAGLEP